MTTCFSAHNFQLVSLHRWDWVNSYGWTCKLITRNPVVLKDTTFQFFLPGHKADRFFEGNVIILTSNPFRCNPLTLFQNYLCSHNQSFPPVITPVAQSEQYCSDKVILHVLPSTILRQRRRWAMRAGLLLLPRWSRSPHHTGYRMLGLAHMANLHLQASGSSPSHAPCITFPFACEIQCLR